MWIRKKKWHLKPYVVKEKGNIAKFVYWSFSGGKNCPASGCMKKKRKGGGGV